MCHIFFIHSSVDGHLGCFHVLAIVNRAAMSIVVHDSFWIMVSSGYMPSSGTAGSYGSSSHFIDATGVSTGIWWVEARVAAEDTAGHETHSKESSDSEHQ